jgi:hypothetical protein
VGDDGGRPAHSRRRTSCFIKDAIDHRASSSSTWPKQLSSGPCSRAGPGPCVSPSRPLGKSRGYVERIEITGKDGGAMKTEAEVNHVVKSLEEYDAVLREVSREAFEAAQAKGAEQYPSQRNGAQRREAVALEILGLWQAGQFDERRVEVEELHRA